MYREQYKEYAYWWKGLRVETGHSIPFHKLQKHFTFKMTFIIFLVISNSLHQSLDEETSSTKLNFIFEKYFQLTNCIYLEGHSITSMHLNFTYWYDCFLKYLIRCFTYIMKHLHFKSIEMLWNQASKPDSYTVQSHSTP